MALTIKQVYDKLKNAGLPIRLGTVYSWAQSGQNGFAIGEKTMTFAGRIGNRWAIQEQIVEEIIYAVNNGKRVGAADGIHKKNETRGRKPGTKFGTYRRRG